jgi:hypothetical protein
MEVSAIGLPGVAAADTVVHVAGTSLTKVLSCRKITSTVLL